MTIFHSGPKVPLAQPGLKVLRVPVRPVRRSVPPVQNSVPQGRLKMTQDVVLGSRPQGILEANPAEEKRDGMGTLDSTWVVGRRESGTMGDFGGAGRVGSLFRHLWGK